MAQQQVQPGLAEKKLLRWSRIPSYTGIQWFLILYAYCIMPNHLHLVFRHLIWDENKVHPITDIMRNFKRYTARECNRILNRRSPFWQPESYDRVIRDNNELENTIRYTLNNPVKAGLAKQWDEWPYSYCKPEYERGI